MRGLFTLSPPMLRAKPPVMDQTLFRIIRSCIPGWKLRVTHKNNFILSHIILHKAPFLVARSRT